MYVSFKIKFQTILNLHEQEHIPLKILGADSEGRKDGDRWAESRGLHCHLGDLLHPPPLHLHIITHIIKITSLYQLQGK